MVMTRTLGRSGLEVSALGLGTMGIGGLFWDRSLREDMPVGYGRVDDAESIRAIHRALDLGVTYFDTADVYGCGHSERVLGQALAGRWDEVIVSTKFGHTFDEATQEAFGDDASPDYIRRACEGSLRRLGVEAIDLYFFHLKAYPLERVGEVRETLEDLVQAGKVRAYGWSTDDVARARLFAEGEHCTAVMHRLNYIVDAPAMLAFCEAENLASVNRIPFLMGILTGKYRDGIDLPDEDMRAMFFNNSPALRDAQRVEALRPVLTAGGRSLPQAALGWIWARSPITIPIPGFKTAAHVEDNAGAMDYGPLSDAQMAAVQEVLTSSA
jgi:aryl-alcohol dehydrogenase-like predicted oxidoreductase